ncbi:MAG: type II secretion system F family protein [Betaproteobacteria bacterium]
MATLNPRLARARASQEGYFVWEGRDKSGKIVRGEMRAVSSTAATATLRRQGILAHKVQKRRVSGGRAIKQKDIAVFTRQMCAMMSAGVPLLQAVDVVARGHPNRRMMRMLNEVRMDIETGTSLSAALRRHRNHFDSLYCNLVEAGESGGVLEAMLERLAVYQERTMALKNKVRSALMYPTVLVVVSVAVLALIMTLVIPTFKSAFQSFGAELPAPTLMVMAISDFVVAHWLTLLAGLGGSVYLFFALWRRSETMQKFMDRLLLMLPVFGSLILKATIARWTRTLSTLSAAGVPLVEALGAVGGASGNAVFAEATEAIRREVRTGTSLTVAMQGTGVFTPMVMQVTAIGEESGSLDHMLGKAAEFYEEEVEETIKGLSSLLEPFIMVVLGLTIGSIMIAMYLPIFKLGSVI